MVSFPSLEGFKERLVGHLVSMASSTGQEMDWMIFKIPPPLVLVMHLRDLEAESCANHILKYRNIYLAVAFHFLADFLDTFATTDGGLVRIKPNSRSFSCDFSFRPEKLLC